MNSILEEKYHLLTEPYKIGERSAVVLRYSYEKINPSKLGSNTDSDFLETQEALAARFARLTDI
ncbi:hypothetical protein [Candidatus Nitrosacidococcus sp. I8]|uniref:hypothetical protein n=1 Tax=Candidatus Nitrosacidococcus sp. I8 TaxID=2942908 RepID=UPI0022270B36|nr:hypothetical protein [Candidatus Nitrosacidococcus sp. I8]CAH9018339.1 hypothetical protein NURINAE_00868 [Candidatus Nitrosacidococcus sp. I8]